MQKHFLLLSFLLALIAMTIAPLHTIAYEVGTHEEISEKAALLSENLGTALPTLGLNSLDDKLVFLPAQGAVMTALKWIRFGSRAEDALFEVGSPIARFRHHFYNPLDGSGLDVPLDFPCDVLRPLGLLPGQPSPDWVLEDNGVGQDYSYKDARDALHKSLTEQSAAEREKHLALMFRVLGHVIHHIQDMAQPQHTRNDPHGPWCLGVGGGGFYEAYTNIPRVRGALPYFGYDAVYRESDTITFDAPHKFWTTSDEKGIADYSNRGFVTTGTNFDREPNPFPSPTLGLGREEDKTALCNQINMPRPNGPDGQPLPCIMTFVETPVVDQYRPNLNTINTEASTFSIFHADMMTYAQKPLFTLNSFNFNAAHSFLIPRAVGYSAGLLNYFFRGVGKLTVAQNANVDYQSEVTNQSTEPMSGTFSLYYETNEGDVYLPENVTVHLATSWSGTLEPGETTAVPSFSSPAPTFRYTLVFQGTMGQEANTAIATAASLVDIPCPPANCVPPPPPPDCIPLVTCE